jgi:hypothetical protein
VDLKLQEINHLVQSSDSGEFRLGFQKLRDRVSASEKAALSLVREGDSALKEERARLKYITRKAPPFLVTILKSLESNSRRDEGKEKLFDLCDDGIASQTIRGLPVPISDVGGETNVALAQLNIVFPSPAPARPVGPSRAASRTQLPESFRTASRPTVNRQPSPLPSRYIESRPAAIGALEQSRSSAGASSCQRPPIGVAVRDFAAEEANRQPARSQGRPQPTQIIAPAPASPQTALYMAGRGTVAPGYISPSKFFAREHGNEHGMERPPAYTTVAPGKPAAA